MSDTTTLRALFVPTVLRAFEQHLSARTGRVFDHDGHPYASAQGLALTFVEANPPDGQEPARFDLTVKRGDDDTWEGTTAYVPAVGKARTVAFADIDDAVVVQPRVVLGWVGRLREAYAHDAPSLLAELGRLLHPDAAVTEAKQGYVAFMLDAASIARLRREQAPTYEVSGPHYHATVLFGVAATDPEVQRLLAGPPPRVTAIALAHDDHSEAFEVVGLKSANARPHVTWSHTAGVRAFASNAMLADPHHESRAVRVALTGAYKFDTT